MDNKRSDYDDIWYGCFGELIGFIIGIMVAIVLCSLVGCSSSKTITNTIVQHDTLKVVNLQKDSVWMHDSVYFEKWMQGDTVYLSKYIEHTAYKDRLRIDTLYKVKTDSVQTTKIQTVEKQLNWWQRLRLTLGNVFLAVLACGGVWLVCRIIR